MKQNIKIFLIALLLGIISAFIVCYKIEPTIITNALQTNVTAFLVGSYNDFETAKLKQEKYPNSIIYNSNGIYKVIIGVYSKKEVIDLMESYFLDKNINFRKEVINTANTLIKDLQDYELLIKSSDKTYYDNINSSMLKQFSSYINK